MEAVIQNTQIKSNSKAGLWTGRIFSGIIILFLGFDSTIHLLNIPAVVEGSIKLGFSQPNLGVVIGAIEVICLALYIFPRTSVFGAILLTGYLGGAIAVQLRVDAPLFSSLLFPVYMGILLWGGLYLRDSRLREIVPFRKNEENN